MIYGRTIELMLFIELFCDSSCKVKPVMDNLIYRTVTDSSMVCPFIDSDWCINFMPLQLFGWSVGHGINLLSSEKDWACLSVLVIEPYFAVLKPFPYIVLNVFCGFQLLIHLQTTKTGSLHAFFVGADGAAMFHHQSVWCWFKF